MYKYKYIYIYIYTYIYVGSGLWGVYGFVRVSGFTRLGLLA